ncbi:MAG: hypothetical protein WCJ84_03860 [Candidatus Peregrinibacteria bacterium]
MFTLTKETVWKNAEEVIQKLKIELSQEKSLEDLKQQFFQWWQTSNIGEINAETGTVLLSALTRDICNKLEALLEKDEYSQEQKIFEQTRQYVALKIKIQVSKLELGLENDIQNLVDELHELQPGETWGPHTLKDNIPTMLTYLYRMKILDEKSIAILLGDQSEKILSRNPFRLSRSDDSHEIGEEGTAKMLTMKDIGKNYTHRKRDDSPTNQNKESKEQAIFLNALKSFYETVFIKSGSEYFIHHPNREYAIFSQFEIHTQGEECHLVTRYPLLIQELQKNRNQQAISELKDKGIFIEWKNNQG